MQQLAAPLASFRCRCGTTNGYDPRRGVNVRCSRCNAVTNVGLVCCPTCQLTMQLGAGVTTAICPRCRGAFSLAPPPVQPAPALAHAMPMYGAPGYGPPPGFVPPGYGPPVVGAVVGGPPPSQVATGPAPPAGAAAAPPAGFAKPEPPMPPPRSTDTARAAPSAAASAVAAPAATAAPPRPPIGVAASPGSGAASLDDVVPVIGATAMEEQVGESLWDGTSDSH